ncbi:MAG TPA: hypothetical protein VME17_06785 [Bryobacteraceae bacterium]|nr:hypothetical protein [Bryobacteraceae bacterium]
MALFFYYVSRQVMNVLASLKKYQQTMMTVKNSSIGPHLERTWLRGMQRSYYCGCRKAAKRGEL